MKNKATLRYFYLPTRLIQISLIIPNAENAVEQWELLHTG